MKKLLIVFAFAVIATGANAQAGKTKPKTQPAQKEATDKQAASQDYFTRHDGKVVIMKGNAMQSMETDMMKFDNGNYITSEGVFVYNNGTAKMMLEEGQRVDMNGNLVMRKGAETKDTKDVPIQAEPAEVK